MATRYARGVGAHSGGLREVLNPWGKIAGSLSWQRGGHGRVGGAAWQKGAAVCLGTAQTRALTGSPVGIPRPRCPPSPPPGRRAQAGEGCLPSQAKHAVGALRARCGVCGVCVGSPWGPVWGRGGPWGARGACEGRQGRCEAPGGRAVPLAPGCFSAAPRRRSPRAPFPGAAGFCRKGTFAPLPGRAAAERQRRGADPGRRRHYRTWAGAGRSGPDPTSLRWAAGRHHDHLGR